MRRNVELIKKIIFIFRQRPEKENNFDLAEKFWAAVENLVQTLFVYLIQESYKPCTLFSG